MGKFALTLAALLWACGPSAFAQAPLQTTTVYSATFAKTALGPVDHLPGGVYDNTYAGGATPLRIVATGDARHAGSQDAWLRADRFRRIVARIKIDCASCGWILTRAVRSAPR